MSEPRATAEQLQPKIKKINDIIKELERRLKVSDAVIKYQTVRLDEDLKRQQKFVRHRERRASRRPRKPAAAPVPQQQVPPAAEQTAAS